MNRAVDTLCMGPGRWWRMVGAAGTAVVVGAGVLAAPVLPAAAAPVGQVTEFSAGISANSRPAGIAVGPDGNLWFTESNGNRIGRITPAGAVTEFTAAGTPTDIAAGPDGNLWFTEFLGVKIGRITPAGVVTEFSVGISADGYPSGIAAGPDGNLWFTEPNGSRIGRITTAAVVTEFSAGITASSSPTNIVAGPDGNMWFTEGSGNRIGRITPAGAVTEFSAGITAGSNPYGIAAGPDGNLWFTESTGNRIGRITPAGAVTEFSAGITAGSGLRDISAGPDGNLWFAELEGQRVGRITPAGVVTEFSAGITVPSNPLGITAGPDGNLWFTESAGSRIGRIGADLPVVPPPPDSTAPMVAMTRPGATTLAARASVAWTGTDAVGVSNYDMRYRSAAWNRTLGGYVNPAALQRTTARSTTQPIALGALYCMSVRARDAAGNVSAWSTERCTAKPLDDRSLLSKGAWAKTRGKVYFAGTIATAKTKGASLTRAGALPGRVALIASKGKGFGKVGIYYNGKLVKRVNLAATKAKTRQVIALPRLAKRGTIMVKVLTAGKTVKVDGLLTARR